MSEHDTTLVLVPGLMCDHAVWSATCDHLGPLAAKAVVPDHGFCDRLEDMAAQILANVPGALAVAGHSMGGRVALEMARLAPERIRHLALLDTGFEARKTGAEGEAEASKRHALLALARSEGVQAMASQWVQGMVHPQRLSDQTLISEILEMFARRSADHFAAQIHALLSRPDASQTLASMEGPVWLICGAQDSWSPVSQHERMAQFLSEPQLHVIEDAGHMAPMEKPQRMAEVLAQWLRSAPLRLADLRGGT
jgi:pimeloyl-ACP methyl ester carboxylesterase